MDFRENLPRVQLLVDRTRCAFRLAIVFTIVIFVSACASHQNKNGQAGDEFTAQEANEDRFEGFNRAMFSFNQTLDNWLLKPVAKGYRWAAPEPVEIGVNNFFSNLGEVGNIFNDVLQWKWKQAGNDTGRVLINSTIGVLGLIDVASPVGLERNEGEDFGQTLAVWGVPRGAYLVLPIFGPSTVRDGVATPVDWYLDPVTYLDPTRDQYLVKSLDVVRQRAELLDVEDLASGDMYIFMRDAYLQRRNYLVNDGEVEDDFGAEAFDDF